MAQILLLKISSDGVPIEMSTASDDITLNSFTIQGGGPVLSTTGLDMNNQDVSDVKDLVFNDPTTDTINQTAGDLIIDNIMRKEKNNLMTVDGAILFPVITDDADQVDSFQLPAIAGTPSATPTASGEGFLVWDSSADKLWAWDGALWKDLSTSEAAALVEMYGAGVALTAREALYISAADTVAKALGDSSSKSYVIGFNATGAASIADPVKVIEKGLLPGFTGLTAGARYYLDASTAGAITATIPVGSGNTIVQVGYAKSTTVLDIGIQQLGRRA